jgi:hypothetical protein
MDLPVTAPILTWREQQLSWFADPVAIQQDQDLIDYIKNNQIQRALIHGDNFFSQYVTTVDTGMVDFVIWMENQSFDFDQLIYNLNQTIAHNLHNNGVIYIAINKFLCQGRSYATELPDDYNESILTYLKTNVNATLESHLFDHSHSGSCFNWVHPLTRFYFRK